MQNLFAEDTPWHAPWINRVLPVVTRIAEQHTDRTVFTRFIPPCDRDELPGSWCRFYQRWAELTLDRIEPRWLELAPPLQRLAPPATMVDKRLYSPFAEPALQQLLERWQADTLVITGAETDVCVLAAVPDAVDLGYRVVLAQDAICSSTDETHDALMTLYGRRFSEQIETVDSDEILASWCSNDIHRPVSRVAGRFPGSEFEGCSAAYDQTKVIFLDIDGVLNCKTTPNPRKFPFIVDPVLLRHLHRLVQLTSATVVLSSTWRFDPAGLFSARYYGIPFDDTLPELPGQPRRDEILAWLRDHAEVKRYIVIDDEDDELDALPLFQPFRDTGLTEEMVDAAASYFNGKTEKDMRHNKVTRLLQNLGSTLVGHKG
jgi:nicotinamidase-related amidase